jgi:PAS domain S-box-containing protein
MNWHSIARHLADRGVACAVVDGAGRIRLFSAALEQLVGWARDEVDGQRWTDALVPGERRARVRARLRRALGDSLSRFDCEVVTRAGRRLCLALDCIPVQAHGVILTVASAREVAVSGAELDDIEYEVSSSDFGLLLGLRSFPNEMAREDPGAPTRCWVAIHGRPSACPDCPLRQEAAAGWPRTVTRLSNGASPSRHEVLVATALEGARFKMRLRRLPQAFVSSMLHANVQALAERAGLSERERAVLERLVDGQSLADISAHLGIRPRTVKFHQARVLAKVGVDSRVKLLQLVVL